MGRASASALARVGDVRRDRHVRLAAREHRGLLGGARRREQLEGQLLALVELVREPTADRAHERADADDDALEPAWDTVAGCASSRRRRRRGSLDGYRDA